MDSEPEVKEHYYNAHGACLSLFHCRADEVLLEGPAGTGKTRALLEYVNWLCETFPKIRVLFARQTREALSDSVLECWEEEVLYPGHPAVFGDAKRNNRQFYMYPNGSRVVLAGLEKQQVGKTYSAQYDIVCVFEAWQVSQDAWSKLGRSCRNGRLPWQQRIADTNPSSEFHWLNQSFPQGYRELPIGHPARELPDLDNPDYEPMQVRLLSRHMDNPVFYDHEREDWTRRGRQYVEGTLKNLKGAPRANLYEGVWASEEGMVFEEYDPAIHMVDEDEVPNIKWYFGSFDKGLRHPGCLQIWGVSHDDQMYRIREYYQTGQLQDWWAAQVDECQQEYGLEALVCDPSEPEYISVFNDRLGNARGRDGERIARKASNAILTGIDMTRWGFSEEDNGPRIFLVRNALMGRDTARVDAKKPCCLEEELPSYVWMQSTDGRPAKERPDPTCADHAVDCLRYAAMFLWRRDLGRPDRVDSFSAGTWGEILGHSEVEYE